MAPSSSAPDTAPRPPRSPGSPSARRPALADRPSSQSSQQSSDGAAQPQVSTSHRAGGGGGLHKPAGRPHVVGHHARLGPRNTSAGKNLNKLGRPPPPPPPSGQGSDGGSSQIAPGANAGSIKFALGTKDHRRSLSGSSGTSPRAPALTRNASGTAVPQRTSHSALKKNYSSGTLGPRKGGSSKNIAKMATKSAKRRSAEYPTHNAARADEGTAAKGHRRKTSAPKDKAHPMVRFDVGSDEGNDDAWTEDSASQSPNTTRSHTRQNSVILDGHGGEHTMGSSTTGEASSSHAPQQPSSLAAAVQSDRAEPTTTPRRPPDADLITSRLLARNNAPPQIAQVSATARPESHDTARALSHSQDSTLNDAGTSGDGSANGSAPRAVGGGSGGSAPGDIVSRFLGSAPSASAAASVVASQANTLISSGGAEKPRTLADRTPSHDGTSEPRPRSASAGANTHRRRHSPHHASDTDSGSDSDRHRRRATTPPAPRSTSSGKDPRRSRSSAVLHPPTNPLAHPYRTQQKLWLQRASSNLDPPDEGPPPAGAGALMLMGGTMAAHSYSGMPATYHHHQPSHVGRGASSAGPASAGTGAPVMLLPIVDGALASGDGRAARRAQRDVGRLMDEVAVEFRGVRRFRDPAGEAARRVWSHVGPRAAVNGTGPVRRSPGPGAGDRRRNGGDGPARARAERAEREEARAQRVTFEVPASGRRAEGVQGRRRSEDDSERGEDSEEDGEQWRRNGPYAICRRMWERVEVVGE